MTKKLGWLYAAVVACLLTAGWPFIDQAVAGPPAADVAQAPWDMALLINGDNPLPQDFEAGDLVSLYELDRSFQLSSSDIYLSRAAYQAADAMFAQAKRDGVAGFILTSGYRTERKQRQLYEDDVDGTAARPGESEHQTGLALDVTARREGGGFDATPQFAWLQAHCWDFGFILRYPQGKEHITGLPYEPWHYRYVGPDVAGAIQANDWTLEEYWESRRAA